MKNGKVNLEHGMVEVPLKGKGREITTRISDIVKVDCLSYMNKGFIVHLQANFCPAIKSISVHNT